MPAPVASKLLLIGWDSADWNLIRPIARQGLLPHLTALIEAGVAGDLASAPPMLSPVAWTTLATGKHPPKHGVHGTLEVSPAGQVRRPSRSSRRSAPLWQILSANHLRTHCINWPASHAAEAINGICISDEFALRAPAGDPSPAAGAVSPAACAAEVEPLRLRPAEISDSMLAELFPHGLPPADDLRLAACRAILSQTATLQAAACWALQRQPWDFASIIFPGLEQLSQWFLRYQPPKLDAISEKDVHTFGHILQAGYQLHDMMLGRLLQLAGDGVTVIVCSDHGLATGKQRHREVARSAEQAAALHRPRGICVLSGPGFKRDEVIEGAKILDIVPTILTLFGLPIGDDMDGQPLTAAFDSPLVRAHIPSWDDHPSLIHALAGPATENEADVNHLLELGYTDPHSRRQHRSAQQVLEQNQFNLARSELHACHPTAAVQHLEPLVSKHPDHPGYTATLLDAYYALEDWPKARRLAQLLWDRGQHHPRVLQAFARIDLGEKRYESALEHLKTAQAMPDAQPMGEMQVLFGLAYLALQAWEEADQAFATALALDDNLEMAWNGRGAAALGLRRPEQAIEFSKRAVAIRPDYAEAHFQLGMAHAALQEYRPAVQALARSAQVNPNNPAVYRQLVAIYQTNLGDPVRAQYYQQRLTTLLEQRRRRRAGAR